MMRRLYTARCGIMPATVLCSLLLISAGCSILNFPPPAPPRPRGPFYFEASYDEVWEAAVEIATELEFRIISMNKLGGIFVTDEVEEGCYGSCLYSSGYSLTVMFERVNGFVRVTPVQSVTSYTKSTEPPYAISAHKIGRSYGGYERDVGRMIAEKLKRPFLLSLPPEEDK